MFMSEVWSVTGSASGLSRSIAKAVRAFGNRLVATARIILTEKIIRSLPRTRLVTGNSRFLTLIASTAIAAIFSAPLIYTFAADTPLLEPHNLIVDRSLPRGQADAQIIAARRYDTFWNTGDEALARAALAPNFVDNTLPTGRPQGIAGPLAASKLMRLAIPDIRCEIEQMIVAGDRVVAHLRFRGHFTGRFGQIQGQGQTINFIATDIYRVADGAVAENWHIEDNLTLQQQLGLIPK
jgi:predicted ester cyclase